MAAREKREEEFNERKNPFRRNALLIIQKMMELNHSSDNHQTIKLVDEILHSIFFLGKISTPPFSPEEILNDNVMLGALKRCYPQPFKLYSSQLPRRSPFSCLLDMIVFLEGQEKEEEIKKKFQEIISELHLKKDEPLVSSTICVSQNTKNPNSEKYYGVSMSTSDKLPGRIMVAASCLSGYWDSYVADAVMSFNPKKGMKTYFDGTIKLPQHVTCKAYSLHGEGAVLPPCKSCVQLFGLGGDNKEMYPYGNCAEVESLSKMFKNDTEVREQAKPTSEKFTDDNREKAKRYFRAELKSLLDTFKLKGVYQFYTPQSNMKGGNIGH